MQHANKGAYFGTLPSLKKCPELYTGAPAGADGSVCPRRRVQFACEVYRLGGLEPGSFTKYHDVPGGSEGSVYPRRVLNCG